jgi:hypothetical protein
MKTVPLILLVATTIMVGTALAAPHIDMYVLDEADCRACHDAASVLKNTNHGSQHDSDFDSCVDCHVKGPRKLDCMKSGCHNEGGVGVTNHHDFNEMGVDDCFACHEKGVPRGR